MGASFFASDDYWINAILDRLNLFMDEPAGILPNPYTPANPPHMSPFFGREQALLRLHQPIADAINTPPLTILGRHGIGKTALLRQFSATASPDILCVMVPLKEISFNDEISFFNMLLTLMIETAEQYGFSLPTFEPPNHYPEIVDWLQEKCFPVIFRVLRPHRRVYILMDDAHILLKAVEGNQLSRQMFADLRRFIQPQFGISLTIDLDYEDDLEMLAPLVNTNLYRLQNLPPEVCADIIRQPVEGLYVVSDDAMNSIYRATGGDPTLIQQFGYWLYQKHDVNTTADGIKAVTPQVYAACEADFEVVWKKLHADEKLVLTALSNLVYDDPIGKINADKIEAWLVETDYPLDATTINAAVRGLEYQEIVSGTASQLMISSGMMQKWLLENAPVEASRPSIRPVASPELPSRTIWISVLILALVLLALVMVSRLGDAANDPKHDVVPTIMLVPRE